MIKRIELVMQSQNLSPSQFADRIGIQRSGLSHILSGRNNPSLDFVLKVLTAFPELEPAWLLQGIGRMYANLSESESGKGKSGGDLFSSAPEPAKIEASLNRAFDAGTADRSFVSEVEPHPLKVGGAEEDPESAADTSDDAENRLRISALPHPAVHPDAVLRKIVFFYEDGTFSEYSPR